MIRAIGDLPSSCVHISPILQSPSAVEIPSRWSSNVSVDTLLPAYFFPMEDGDQDYSHQFFADFLNIKPGFDMTGLQRDLTNEFSCSLTDLVVSLPKDHPECAPNLNLAEGMSLLTSDNIQRFVEIYFRHWNRHSPVIHRGTFDVDRVSLPLLLVVVLTGALFSMCPSDILLARKMLDIAEEFAFRNPMFLKLSSGILPHRSEEHRLSLEAVQAAFSIAQIQLRECCLERRKNIRSDRFDKIIYVRFQRPQTISTGTKHFQASRTISLPQTQNKFNKQPNIVFEDFEWDAFAFQESKIRYGSPPSIFASINSFIGSYVASLIWMSVLPYFMICRLAYLLTNYTLICLVQ